MPSPMCVLDRNGHWHALADGVRLDPDAWSDQIRCGGFIIARFDHARRRPTCIECRGTGTIADIVLNRSRRPNPPVPEPSEEEK